MIDPRSDDRRGENNAVRVNYSARAGERNERHAERAAGSLAFPVADGTIVRLRRESCHQLCLPVFGLNFLKRRCAIGLNMGQVVEEAQIDEEPSDEKQNGETKASSHEVPA